MKQRHWDRIAGLTGHTFDMESETFSLRNIMEAPLLKSKEDIEVCAVISFQQYSVGSNFEKDVYSVSDTGGTEERFEFS